MPAVLPQVVVTAASLIWPSQVSFLGACKGRIHAGVLEFPQLQHYQTALHPPWVFVVILVFTLEFPNFFSA